MRIITQFLVDVHRNKQATGQPYCQAKYINKRKQFVLYKAPVSQPQISFDHTRSLKSRWRFVITVYAARRNMPVCYCFVFNHLLKSISTKAFATEHLTCCSDTGRGTIKLNN